MYVHIQVHLHGVSILCILVITCIVYLQSCTCSCTCTPMYVYPCTYMYVLDGDAGDDAVQLQHAQPGSVRRAFARRQATSRGEGKQHKTQTNYCSDPYQN